MEVDHGTRTDGPYGIAEHLVRDPEAAGGLIQDGVIRSGICLTVCRVVSPVIAGQSPFLIDVVVDAIRQIVIVGRLGQTLLIVVDMVITDSRIIGVEEGRCQPPSGWI